MNFLLTKATAPVCANRYLPRGELEITQRTREGNFCSFGRRLVLLSQRRLVCPVEKCVGQPASRQLCGLTSLVDLLARVCVCKHPPTKFCFKNTFIPYLKLMYSSAAGICYQQTIFAFQGTLGNVFLLGLS